MNRRYRTCRRCQASQAVSQNSDNMEATRACCTQNTDIPLVAAGTVSACQNSDSLASIYFQSQNYCSGFCPEQSLMQGTMFPELVRIYK
ncbi:MAG: spore coat associated protein CotJA [Clostridia bacterium]|nr:spore coat associated protein CotJA [Oscillospiraceae bacterium]MBQ3551641.1 spore coat associated protein CotJA [Clostridia bacterium]